MPRPTSQPAPARRRFFLFRVPVLAVLVLVLGAGAVWWQRLPLLTWCCLHELARAGDADRDAWAVRVASLDRAAVPGLVGLLTQEAPACAGAEAALKHLAEHWGADDPRRPELAGELADALPRLSAAGRQAVLRLEAGWLSGHATVPPGAPRLLRQAARADDPGTHACGLDLAAVLLARPDHAQWAGDCREVIQAGLADPEPATRLRALPLALRPEVGLLERAMVLLHDPAAEVRREAMFAARSAPETVVKTESLLRWLHDPDEEVRRLCEAVLRGRNLSEEHLRIGRLLTDDRPTTRLQVLRYLRADSDLEPGVWLRLLSVDPEPAVRVAAVRAAVADPRVDLSDRLDQMARSDPSPSVSRLARYYLSCQQQRKASAAPQP